MTDIEGTPEAARPSADPGSAAKVRRLIRPEALSKNEPLFWSAGTGTDVWDMFCACITGDLETVRRLIGRDPSLARAHYEYRTPLSFAVRENRREIAAFLLDHGADPFGVGGDLLEVARDRGYVELAALLEGRYADLHGASSKGEPVAAAIRERDLAKVRRLLDEAPELLHAGDRRSGRPIHWAVMTRQIDMIDELLARGADINARRQDGARPIHLTNGDYHYRGWRDVPAGISTTPDAVYRHLVARGAEVDIHMAAAKGDLDRVRALLGRDPSLANRVSEYRSYYLGCGTPIRNAAAAGHLDIVKLLLAHGADPNAPEEGIAPRGHALYAAVANGHYEVAMLLLAHGAHPNVEVESSADTVSRAVMNADRKMIALLASHGATWEIPMEPGAGLTYDAIAATGVGRSVAVLAHFGDTATAGALFAARPALADDPEALEHAARNGHEAFVRLMLRCQPDLARRVTVSRPRELAALLFAQGMDPNRPDWLRITPLHRFAGRGDVESAALFLAHGADLHARDEEHRSTPLGCAAKRGHTRMVEFLLRRGAKPRLPDDPPWATPLAWATRRGHDAVVRLLTEFERSGALPARGLEHHETLVGNLVEACQSGEDAAVRRVADLFQIQRELTWDRPQRHVLIARLRRLVRARLGRQSDAESEALLPADAQLLVARAYGFESWPELVEHAEGRHS